jgi:hypothetical protein
MAGFESKACVTNRNLKFLCVCICSFAKGQKIDVMLHWFKPVLHPSSEEGRALANFPMNRGFLEENSVTLRFWLCFQWNNQSRSIKFKWLIVECSFRLIWFQNLPNIFEKNMYMYIELENLIIHY